MNLQELKILLDWASDELNKKSGSKNSYPEQYEKAQAKFKVIKQKFDDECERIINELITKN